MEDIFLKIVDVHESGRFAVLATLIKLSGSALRGTGTKCLILEDGSFEGTVGGGLLEARVLKVAEEIFFTLAPERLHFVLKGKDVAESEILCDGDTEVFLEPIPPGSLTTLEIYKRVAEIQKRVVPRSWPPSLIKKCGGEG